MPYNYLPNAGVITPETDAIKTEVIAEARSVLGDDLVVDDNTAGGVLVNMQVITRKAMTNNNAAMANLLNPSQAGGIAQDAIGALTGSERSGAVKTTVACVMGGAQGTLILAGSKATDGANTFSLVADALIGAAGTVAGTFVCDISGPIGVTTGTLTIIKTLTLGWETITNNEAGVPGQEEQKDAPYFHERNATLALMGSGVIEASMSRVRALNGVLSVTGRENFTSVDGTFDGIPVLKNSIWICADGGSDLDIATALSEAKGGGCNWTGATVVPMINAASGQPYNVSFDRTEVVPCKVRVTISQNSANANPAQAVKDAIVAYANGELKSDPGLVTGVSLAPPELGGAINIAAPGIYAQNIEVTTVATDVYQQTLIPIALNQKAQVLEGSIEVVFA